MVDSRVREIDDVLFSVLSLERRAPTEKAPAALDWMRYLSQTAMINRPPDLTLRKDGGVTSTKEASSPKAPPPKAPSPKAPPPKASPIVLSAVIPALDWEKCSLRTITLK